MNELRLLAAIVNELLARKTVPRGPTPSSILGAQGGIAAKQFGGQVNGRAAAGYLFNTALVSQTIAGSTVCADLGCGTAVQLLQIAFVNPEIQFIGVDREPQMLRRAAENAAKLGVKNVRWVVDDITAPQYLSTLGVDAVIANMTLHDLPDMAAVIKFAESIKCLLPANSAIYLEDFVRLKRTNSMEVFAELNAPSPPDDFHRLFRASLSAAYTYEELRVVQTRLPSTMLFTTFPFRFLAAIKTEERALPIQNRARIIELYRRLSKERQAEVTNLRRLFAWGGLKQTEVGLS